MLAICIWQGLWLLSDQALRGTAEAVAAGFGCLSSDHIEPSQALAQSMCIPPVTVITPVDSGVLPVNLRRLSSPG